MRISWLTKLLDLVAPRRCVICGNRLSPTEEQLCLPCVVHLPRTGFSRQPLDNRMARQFWGLMPIEKAAALFYFASHSDPSRAVYSLKYRGNVLMGNVLGRLMAREMAADGFFEGIDLIVPVPLAPKRLRQRGYNQSEVIARGVSDVTGLPVAPRLLSRKAFHGSQTRLHRWQRMDNVKDLFELEDACTAAGKHILLIDDVVTTGATIQACGEALKAVDGIKISVLALGFTKS